MINIKCEILKETSKVCTVSQNGTLSLKKNEFCGVPLSPEDEMTILKKAITDNQVAVDENGVLYLDDDGEMVENGTKINGDVFAGISESLRAKIPSDEGQWYNKKPDLLELEINLMKKRFPGSVFGFLKSNNNMYWVVDMQISKTGFCDSWKIMLVYDRTHPNNYNFGGSIKVYPVSPDENKLKERAIKAGKVAVPHLLFDEDTGKVYLCTRRTEDVRSGKIQADTAVSVTGWAADWALHYELGLKNDVVWNKFCDDDHFFKLKSCYSPLKCGEVYNCKNCVL